MRFTTFIFMLTLVFALAGCGRPDVKGVLTECKELKGSDDPDRWRKIAVRLESLYNDKRINNDTENVAAMRNFYVMSLMRTANGDWAKAAEIADQVQKNHDDNFLANYQLGKIRLEQGKAQVAYQFLEQAHKIESDNVLALTALLNAAEKAGYPDAERYFQKAATMDAMNRDPKFFNIWGLWQIKQGQETGDSAYFMRAHSTFYKGYRLDEHNPQICLHLAILWDKHLNKPKAAQRYYVSFKNTLRFNSEMNTRENHLMVQQRLRDLRQ